MPRLVLVLVIALAGLVVSGRSPAFADDEVSDHTAQLVGDPRDTLGVTITFDEKAGWSMAVRARPGAAERTFQLALPKHHAHYVVLVAQARKAITFVEVMAGRTKPSPNDGLAWQWSPDGTLVRSWRYGDLFSATELERVARSSSHFWWTSDRTLTASALDFVVEGSKRTIVLDRKTGALR